jgi:hypothetical protein
MADYSLLIPHHFSMPIKNFHYYTESCDPPPNHACIEVEVFDEHITHLQTRDGWQKDILKKVGTWKLFDYQRLLQRKNLVGYDQIIDFFSYGYRGEEDIIENLNVCSIVRIFFPKHYRQYGRCECSSSFKKNHYGKHSKNL